MEQLIYLEDLNSHLIFLVNELMQENNKILILLSNKRQIKLLSPYLSSSVKLALDLDRDHYDYLFYLKDCATNLDLLLQYGDKVVLNKKVKNNYNNDVKYHDSFYTLDELDSLYYSLAKQAATLSYLYPHYRILLLVPEINVVDEQLRRANLKLPIVHLDQELNGPGIIIAEREDALFLASEINPNYIIDSMIEKNWVSTWTQGRRLRERYISQEEADHVLILGDFLYRMIPEKLYLGLDKVHHSQPCRWRSWIEQEQKTTKKPLLIERCWKHLTSPSRGELRSPLDKEVITPELNEFLNTTNLGLYPSLVLWKWSQDNLPLFPMLSLIALIDSYGPSYLSYPEATREYTNRLGEYQTLRSAHRKRYFDKFRGDNDLEVLLKMWLDLLDYSGGFDDVLIHLKEWSLKNSMNEKKFLEVYLVIQDLILFFEKNNKDNNTMVIKGPFDISAFLDKARAYIEVVYAQRLIMPLIGTSIYQRDEQTYNWVGDDYTLSPQPKGPVYALVVHQSNNTCLLWLNLPRKEEEEEEKEEIVVDIIV